MTRISARRDRGLTLVELMVAMSVLAVGLIGMLTMQTQALQGSRHGKQVSEAARVAQQQMELLHRQPWATMPPSPWSAPRILNGPVNGIGPSTPQPYSIIWRVQAGPAANLRRLDVQVNWTIPDAPAGAPGSLYAISSLRHNDP